MLTVSWSDHKTKCLTKNLQKNQDENSELSREIVNNLAINWDGSPSCEGTKSSGQPYFTYLLGKLLFLVCLLSMGELELNGSCKLLADRISMNTWKINGSFRKLVPPIS